MGAACLPSALGPRPRDPCAGGDGASPAAQVSGVGAACGAHVRAGTGVPAGTRRSSVGVAEPGSQQVGRKCRRPRPWTERRRVKTCGSPAPRPSPRRSGAAAAWGPRLPLAAGLRAAGSARVTWRPAFLVAVEGRGGPAGGGCLASLSEPGPTIRPFPKCRCPFEQSLQRPGCFAEAGVQLPACDPGWGWGWGWGGAGVFTGSVEGGRLGRDGGEPWPRRVTAASLPPRCAAAAAGDQVLLCPSCPCQLQSFRLPGVTPNLRQVELLDRIISCK